MASDKASVASGADHTTQTTRRRNVPSSNGGLVDIVEIDDKKTKVKKVNKTKLLSVWQSLGHELTKCFTESAFSAGVSR
jgi:dolichyl-phosphate-mannose-protein mannosyltransferase